MNLNKWTTREDYRPLLKETCKKFPTFLSHVEQSQIYLCSFVKEHSPHVARIHSIRPPWSLALPKHVYLIEFHANRFDSRGEAFKMYVMFHELLHIYPEGFDPASSYYRRLVKHDIEDFSYLLNHCGIHMENLNDILKGEKGLLKKGPMRFPRLEVIH